MLKIFISQPMNNRRDSEILGERLKAVEWCDTFLKGPYEIIDSFIQDAPKDAKPLWYLGKSFESLSEADIAIFTRGWKEARGCVLEHKACEDYGIATMEL